jgi:hypothetical protein
MERYGRRGERTVPDGTSGTYLGLALGVLNDDEVCVPIDAHVACHLLAVAVRVGIHASVGRGKVLQGMALALIVIS